MRWRCAIAALVGIVCSAPAAGDEFPYVAYVNTADVYVRSGPGRNYYPTDKLAKGDKVEIYRHDPGGWYAIRPPRHSFSWVSSRHLKVTHDGLAKVDGDRVVARVGSAFSDVRDVIQVRLDKGELVELLEPLDSSSPWSKIAPPSGEFRWVFSKYVDRDGSLATADDDRGREGDPLGHSRDAEHGSPVRLAGGQAEPTATRDGGATPLASEAAMQRELDRIDLQLSAMVVEDVTAWSFVDLQRRAEAVLDAAQTPVARGRARVMLTKLARFEDIRRRHAALRGAPGGEAMLAAPRRADDGRFDGVGRLSPVISQQVGGPSYALVDESNAVVSFVTPAPGVNLRPYVDQVVGVNGQRGYLTDLQRQHINVQRVTVLDVMRR